MLKKTTTVFLLSGFLHLLGCNREIPTVAIQPFRQINKNLINKLSIDIQKQYDVKIIILPPKELPVNAYYHPKQRYRADKLLKFLRSEGTEYTKILGLTDVDISAAKGNIKDWGIFGLGSVVGKACVVSTYRLKRGFPVKKRFYNRVLNTVIHELGHTFGLWHCPDTKCIMQDAKGKMTSVDKIPYSFCNKCSIKISSHLTQKSSF